MKTYITLTTIDYYLDINEIKAEEELLLEKDKDNIYDGEAIKVLGKNRCIKGYVGNSINTVCKGAHSVLISTISLTIKLSALLDLCLIKV